MGRIKSAMIRKAAREIVETAPGFSTDFEHNKKLLSGSMHYKSVRNKVAGCITSMLKKQQKQTAVQNE